MGAQAEATGGARGAERYPVMDALRCVLALWVTVGHLGNFPIFAPAAAGTGPLHYMARAWTTVVWGVPAVIGFFVISGFCIHLPFRGDEQLAVGRYYARRYTRILLPVVAVLLINEATGNQQVVFGSESVLWKSVLWSLFCEEIYYAVYPAARAARMRFGWKAVLAPAFGAAALVGLQYPNALDGSITGALKTAVILFPIWLLGCVLAEQSAGLKCGGPRGSIWGWRAAAWFGSWTAGMLHFHADVSQELAMLCFGVLAYFWMQQEIANSGRARPVGALVWAGMWSYSLYLMHLPASALLSRAGLPSLGRFGDWLVLYGFVASLSYAFYVCIERPSHRMARRIHVLRAKASAGAVLSGATVEATTPVSGESGAILA